MAKSDSGEEWYIIKVCEEDDVQIITVYAPGLSAPGSPPVLYTEVEGPLLAFIDSLSLESSVVVWEAAQPRTIDQRGIPDGEES